MYLTNWLIDNFSIVCRVLSLRLALVGRGHKVKTQILAEGDQKKMKNYQTQVLSNANNNSGLFFRFAAFAVLSMMLTVFGQTVVWAATGFDFSFGADGKQLHRITNPPNGFGYAQSILLEGGGNRIVAGGTADGPNFVDGFAIMRMNPDGSLDPSFAINGSGINQFTSNGVAVPSGITAIAFQPDGRIIAAGVIDANTRVIAVVRYNFNGQGIDSTFGNNGAFILGFSPADAVVNEIVVQTDGKIILAGSVGQTGARNFLVARLNANGLIDATFGGNGTGFTTTDFNGGDDEANSVLQIQPEGGQIYVAGFSATNGARCAMARYTLQGLLDTSFGTGGRVITDPTPGQIDFIYKILRQPSDNKIVAIGTTGGAGDAFLLLRYFSDGAIDTSFGTNGIVATNFDGGQEFATSGVVLPNGKIMAAGFVSRPNFAGSKFSVARYNANGTLDKSLGCDGLSTVSFSSGGATAFFSDAAVYPDGRAIFATGDGVNTSSHFAFARYQADDGVRMPCSAFDFEGDDTSDISVYRGESNGTGTWYRLNSSTNFPRTVQFGLATDKLAPADYDGDGRTDHAVFRNGEWYILQSSNNQVRHAQFGIAEDLPRPGNFDGDGLADIAVFRPSSGTWYFQRSTNAEFGGIQWGQSGDVPMLGDYDLDGKTDFAVFRPSNGFWYINRSSDGDFRQDAFGLDGDIPLNGDFNGDGRSDLAVFRPSDQIWYVARPTGVPGQNFEATRFGLSSDIPVTADYDGDGRTDIAVYRSGVWYILKSGDGEVSVRNFGLAADKPIPAAYLP